MSADLHDRLIVSEDYGRKGLVKIGAVKIDLARLPEPPRFLRAFMNLWWTPGIRQAEVQEDCLHSRRDMRPEEVAGAERLTNGLGQRVQDYLG